MEIGSLLFGHLLTGKVLGQGSWTCSANNGIRSFFIRWHRDGVAQFQSGCGPIC
jgi:hypothetical protein